MSDFDLEFESEWVEAGKTLKAEKVYNPNSCNIDISEAIENLNSISDNELKKKFETIDNIIFG
jgi:predicted alternative tryptophan synthase beta-subunit